jgi:hypothetical protein
MQYLCQAGRNFMNSLILLQVVLRGLNLLQEPAGGYVTVYLLSGLGFLNIFQ